MVPSRLITVAGLDGGTHARTLDEVEEMARDFIAKMTDASLITINLVSHVNPPTG